MKELFKRVFTLLIVIVMLVQGTFVSFASELEESEETVVIEQTEEGDTSADEVSVEEENSSEEQTVTEEPEESEVVNVEEDSEVVEVEENPEVIEVESNSALRILEQPENGIGYIGETVKFNVNAQGEKLSYYWYYSYDNGKIWRKCIHYNETDKNGNTKQVDFVGGTSNTLEITFSKMWLQKLFKCVVTDEYGNSIETNVVHIEPGKIVINNQSGDTKFQAGDSQELFVDAKGIDLQYRWYESQDSGITWKKTFELGYSKAQLSLNNLDETYNNRQYYCLLKDRYGMQVKSEVITLEYNEGRFAVYNKREILGYNRDVLLNHEQIVAKASFNENIATFSCEQKNLNEKDVVLFTFSARSKSDCTFINFSVNGNQGVYSSMMPVQIYEEDYIIPIVGLSYIDAITIGIQSDASIEIGNFELCNLGQVDVANYQTGIIAVNKPSTELNYDSGAGFIANDSAVYDNCLYTVGQGVLTVYDITNPNTPIVIGCLTGLGETRDIAVANDGDTLVIACRANGVNIVDVSDRYAPRLIRNIETMGMATSVSVSGGYCFVTTRRHGLEIYDISQLDQPSFCTQINENQEEIYGCCVSDGYLYISSWAEQKVHIYSLKNIYKPAKVAEIHTDGNAAGLTIENGKLYVATGYNSSGTRSAKTDMNYGMGNGFEIYDVSQPSSPTLLSISKIDGRYFISGFDHWRVAVSNNVAYVTNAYNGVYVYDVSNPSAPNRIEKITVNIPKTSKKYSVISNAKYLFPYDQTDHAQSIVTSVAPIKGNLFITTNTGDVPKSYEDVFTKKTKNGLYVIARDYAEKEVLRNYSYTGVKDNSNAQIISLPDYGLAAILPAHGNAQSVAIIGDKMIVAEGVSGAYIYSLKDWSSEKIDGIETAISVVVVDKYIYISEAGKGIKIFQLNEGKLQNINTYETQSGASINNLHASPDGSYLIGQKGLYEYVILDITNKSEIVQYSSTRTGGMYCSSITTDATSKDIFGIVNRNVLLFFKINDEGKPELINSVSNSRYIEDDGITGYKNYIIQIDYKGYIYYDPAEVTDKTLTSRRIVISGYTVRGIPKIIGNTMFVSDNLGHKLTLIDISTINKPKVITQVSVEGNPCEIYENNGNIIIPLGHNGIMVMKGR